MRHRSPIRAFRGAPAALTAASVALAVGVLIAVVSPRSWFTFAIYETLLFTTTMTVVIVNARLVRDAFSPLTLTAVFYAVAFGAGGIYFWISPGPFEFRYEPEHLTHALLLANIGWLLLLAGYLINPLGPLRSVLPPFPRTPQSASIVWTVGPLLVVGWAARLELVASNRYFHTPTRDVTATGSSWIISIAALLPTLAAAFVGARSLMGSHTERTSSLRRMFFLLVAVEVAWYAPTGGRSNLIGLALMVAVVSYYGRGQRMPWKSTVLSVILLVFLIFPLAIAYRAKENRYQQDPVSAFSRAARQTFGHGLGGLASFGATATFSRFSDVTSLALISSRERTPLGGSSMTTLTWIPQTFVPRSLLKSKEDPGLVGNQFGETYNLSAPGFLGTSIAISQVGELYLNFGVLGLLIGMPLVGGFYRLLGDYFAARKHDSAILAVYAVAAWQLVNGQETIIALGLVGVFKAMLFFALMIILTTAIQRRWAPRGAARLGETAA